MTNYACNGLKTTVKKENVFLFLSVVCGRGFKHDTDAQLFCFFSFVLLIYWPVTQTLTLCFEKMPREEKKQGVVSVF